MEVESAVQVEAWTLYSVDARMILQLCMKHLNIPGVSLEKKIEKAKLHYNPTNVKLTNICTKLRGIRCTGNDAVHECLSVTTENRPLLFRLLEDLLLSIKAPTIHFAQGI